MNKRLSVRLTSCSGKLPYTIALTEEAYLFADIENSTALLNTDDPNAWQSEFKEGLLIDYRHFDYYNQSVAFEFGFGLSYTTFELSTLAVQDVYGGGNISSLPSGPILPGGKSTLWNVLFRASLTVTNIGTVIGATVSHSFSANGID